MFETRAEKIEGGRLIFSTPSAMKIRCMKKNTTLVSGMALKLYDATPGQDDYIRKLDLVRC